MTRQRLWTTCSRCKGPVQIVGAFDILDVVQGKCDAQHLACDLAIKSWAARPLTLDHPSMQGIVVTIPEPRP